MKKIYETKQGITGVLEYKRINEVNYPYKLIFQIDKKYLEENELEMILTFITLGFFDILNKLEVDVSREEFNRIQYDASVSIRLQLSEYLKNIKKMHENHTLEFNKNDGILTIV